MKKFLKYTALTLVVLAVLGYAGLQYSTEKRRATPAPDALAAVQSDAAVEITDAGPWIVYQPTGAEPTTGVILYPGANCDVRGYAPVLRPIAAAGYLVVDTRMPFDFAIFAPNKALEVEKAFPGIKHWILVGHSMGGAMAGQFVHNHPDAVSGLIVWDSYPPDYATLADSKVPVWHIHRATPEGQAPESFTKRRGLFPPDSHWVAVPGGVHMYFGSFVGGAYKEDWTPSISRESQHEQVVAATLEALAVMAPQAVAPPAVAPEAPAAADATG